MGIRLVYDSDVVPGTSTSSMFRNLDNGKRWNGSDLVEDDSFADNDAWKNGMPAMTETKLDGGTGLPTGTYFVDLNVATLGAGFTANFIPGNYQQVMFGVAEPVVASIPIASRVFRWNGTAIEYYATAGTVDTVLTASHGEGDWTAAAASINILPLAASPSASGRLSDTRLTAYQYTTINATLSITDNDGDPVSLAGKTLALVAWDKNDRDIAIITMRTDGGSPELSIGGDDNNQVTIDGGVAHTVNAVQLDWRLYNLTDLISVATGVLNIVEGAALPAL